MDAVRRQTKHGVVSGYIKCPTWLKRAYYLAVNGNCKDCHKHFESLEPHRIQRGNEGGIYTVAPIDSLLSNVKLLCTKCHKKYHQNEKGCGCA